MIQTWHGYNEEIILELINKFVTWNKIAYDPQTHEFMVLSWMKHNRPNNSKVFCRVGKEVRATKSKTLKDLWSIRNPLDAEKIGQPFTIDTVSIPTSIGMDTVCIPTSIGIGTVQIPEVSECKNDVSSSVLGSSSVDLNKEVGCSLPGLKQEEPGIKHQEVSNHSTVKLNVEEKKSEPTPELKLEPKRENTPHQSSAGPPPATDPDPEEVIIRYLNRKLCSGYQLDSGSTRKLIQKKLSEGFGVRDFMVVIDKKVEDWQDPKYRSNLIPHVLFGDKFESYLEQCPRNEKLFSGKGNRMPISTFHNHTSEIVEVF
jgi:uncharacterized phage protein (TIGR02220 family)